MIQRISHLFHRTTKALKQNDIHALQAIFKEFQPYDLMQVYLQLSSPYRETFIASLSIEQLADLVSALTKDEQMAILKGLDQERLSQALEAMDNDNIVSLITDLDPHQVDVLISRMNVEQSAIIRNLMNYAPETAGRMMNNQFVWIKKNYTVREAVDKLKVFAELAEYLNYLYVIDHEKKLVGVVSYRDLLLADMLEKIEDIMTTRVVKVDAGMDQEDVATLMQRYGFITIPVINEDHILLGIVTVDDILDVVYHEANEDIEKLSAAGQSIDFNTKPLVAASRRLTWLILLLFIGIVSGGIIASFESTLEQVVALAFFMPMIAGMTGNTGTQSLAIVVRGLTVRDLDLKQVLKLLIRELWVGIIIGLTCGALIFIIAYIWQGNATLGFVVGLSLLSTLVIGTLAGTIIPLILYRLNIDPAVASGPLITTINDILSLLIYFGIATFFLTQLM